MKESSGLILFFPYSHPVLSVRCWCSWSERVCEAPIAAAVRPVRRDAQSGSTGSTFVRSRVLTRWCGQVTATVVTSAGVLETCGILKVLKPHSLRINPLILFFFFFWRVSKSRRCALQKEDEWLWFSKISHKEARKKNLKRFIFL